MTKENILLVNFLGKQFDLPLEILSNYPDTLLANQELLSKYYRSDKNDYYFERNPLLFPYIFMYYTLNRKIFCPHHIPIELIKIECDFFLLTNPMIYLERNRTSTHYYCYFSRKYISKNDYFIEISPLISGLIFMINLFLETTEKTLSWSLSYFLELISIFLLTITIVYQIIFLKDFLRNKSFVFDFFSITLSLLILTSENLLTLTNYSFINILLLIFKILRLLILIGHLRILRLILRTIIQE